MTIKTISTAGIKPLTGKQAAALPKGTPLVILSAAGWCGEEYAHRWPVGAIVTLESVGRMYDEDDMPLLHTKEGPVGYTKRFGLVAPPTKSADNYTLSLPVALVDDMLLTHDDEGYYRKNMGETALRVRQALVLALRQQVPNPTPADERAAIALLSERGYTVTKEG